MSWTPANLAVAPQVWLDADDASTITTVPSPPNNFVSEWRDKSGNARHATTNSGGVTVAASAINGRTALDFTGDSLITPAFQAFPSKRGAMFVLWKSHASGGYGTLLATYNRTAPSWQLIHPGSGFPRYGFFDAVSTRTLSADFAPYDTGTPKLVELIRDADSSCASYFDGNLYNAAITHANNQPASNQMNIGASTGGETMTGYLAEIVILGYAPTSGEREQIEGYLAHKWGTTASLPSGHPYKSAAPTTTPRRYPRTSNWLV